VSGLELGGLFGSLTSGAVSDHLVRSNNGSKGNVGLRVQARPPRRAAPPLPPWQTRPQAQAAPFDARSRLACWFKSASRLRRSNVILGLGSVSSSATSDS